MSLLLLPPSPFHISSGTFSELLPNSERKTPFSPLLLKNRIRQTRLKIFDKVGIDYLFVDEIGKICPRFVEYLSINLESARYLPNERESARYLSTTLD